MGSELEPCPFCGGDLILVEDRGDNGCEKLLYRPQCRKCGGGLGGHYSKAEALAAWNRRSEPRGDSPLAPEGAPQPASGGNRDPAPSSAAGAWVTVPREPTREMLNAAIDTDSHKLGDISPLGFRISPQMMFERCYRAMIASAPKAEVEGPLALVTTQCFECGHDLNGPWCPACNPEGVRP